MKMKCKLCFRENDLCQSHIIPEFFYKPIYDEKRRLNVIPLSEEEKHKYEQKGIRERLLCRDCEKQLSTYEDYVCRVWDGRVKKCKMKNSVVTTQIHGLDYKKFKLFQLSVLWRSSISSHKFFKEVKLGPHEEVIRQMLIYENPGKSTDYPCAMTLLILKQKEIMNGFIYPTSKIRMNGKIAYNFTFGGCFWCFFVARQKDYQYEKNLFIRENGDLLILKNNNVENSKFFKDIGNKLLKYDN